MALPGNINTITLTGDYSSLLAVAATGTVMIAPTSTLTDTSGQTVLTAAPAVVALVAGAFSVVLPCTDNASLRPNPFLYVITVTVAYATQTFTVALPSTLGSTVDISALAPIPNAATPVNGIYVTSVNGQSGSLTLPVFTSSALPAGAVAETAPRSLVTSSTMTMTSGSLYLAQVTLASTTGSNGWSWVTGSTGSTTTSHWWGVLLSNTFRVLAVTPDQGTRAIAPNALLTASWSAPFNAPLSSAYYWGVSVAASGMPTSAATGAAPGTAVSTALPPLAGVSSTGLAGPPTIGQVMTPPAAATVIPYGYID